MKDLKQFVGKVAMMRTAQALYFQQIAKAKKTKLPGDFATAANALKTSKQLEIEVDHAIAQIHLAVQSSCSGNCGMNYCDDNGCVERKRNLTEPQDQAMPSTK